jgi:hypothetical protein
VRDQVADVDATFHVPVDDPRDVGTALSAAERSATAGPQLERPSGDLLPRRAEALWLLLSVRPKPFQKCNHILALLGVLQAGKDHFGVRHHGLW